MKHAGTDFLEPFRIDRRFAVVGIICFAIWTVASTWAVTSFVRKQMLDRDAQVTQETLLLTIKVLDAVPYIQSASRAALSAEVIEFLEKLPELPDVFRVIVYDRAGNVLWSSEPELEGRPIGKNPELAEAILGRTVYSLDRVSSDGKHEHRSFPDELHGREFVEIYMPVFADDGQVAGVIELYRYPRAIMKTLREGRTVVWVSALAGSLMLYLVLWSFVRRGARIIEAQKRELERSRALAAIADMTPIVAHNIRNPLASIRSSAELNIDDEFSSEAREAFAEILERVDRIDAWLADLLRLTGGGSTIIDSVDVCALVDQARKVYSACAETNDVQLTSSCDEHVPLARGDPGCLQQILFMVMNNALDAMPGGGNLELRVLAHEAGRDVVIAVRDDGEGLAPEVASRLFEPFVTTKRHGSGLGLALARRVLESWQGGISLENNAGRGVTARIFLRRADD